MNPADPDRKYLAESDHEQEPAPVAAAPPPPRIVTFLFTFLLMFLLWVLLSGRFDAFHLSLGVISCLLVAFISGDLLETVVPRGRASLGLWWRFTLYVPWLLWQIFLANLHVLKLTFEPRLLDKIDPYILRFHSKLKSDLALTTFANSITLTPGTITVRVSPDGDFVVHAIDLASGEPLPGEMEQRVAETFGET
ncbi:MAG: Na+/H+ antiporter subunit E [Deltaproteobacteria bacterium]|nr:Na+/H+ antiporter subunit E [Deltaproteobacteria bacterium]